MRSLVLFSTGVLLIATAAGQAAAAPSVTVGSCTTSNSYTWNGTGDNHDWSDADNWSGQHVPSSSDSAVIEGTPDSEMFPDTNVPASICNLTIGDNVHFEPGPAGITVNGNLDWHSGMDDSLLEGSLTVAGTAELSSADPSDAGLVYENGGDGVAMLTVQGSATVDSQANLELGSSDENLRVDGALQVGAGAYLWSNASGGSYGSSNAAMDIYGTVSLTGDVESESLDWNLDPVTGVTPKIDLAGHTLTLDSAGNSRWKSGGEIISSGGPGVIDDRGDLLMVDGTTTLGPGVTFKLDNSGEHNRAALSDGAYYATDGGPTGAAATFAGPGTFDFTGGTIYGTFTLGSSLTTRIHGDTAVSDTYGPGSVVSNHGTLSIGSGTFDGMANTTPRVRNYASATISGGATVSGFDWTNEAGSTLHIVKGTASAASKPATLDRVTMREPHATISVAKGARVDYEESDVTLDATTLTGGGTVQNSDGTLRLLGTTTVRNGTTLRLGGPADHSTFVLSGHASKSTKTPATLHGGPGGGKIAFQESEIRGQLKVDSGITTTVTTTGNYRAVESGNGFGHGLLELDGPTSIKGSTLYTDGDSHLALAGKLSISGGSSADPAGLDGSGTITVAHHGSVTVAAKAHAEFGSDALASSGSLAIGSKAKVLAGTVTLGGGTLSGLGTLIGKLRNTGGTVNPGSSSHTPGTLTITGDYTQGAHGTLRIDVQSGTRHDTLAINGHAGLKGRLVTADANTHRPPRGAHARGILTASSRSGKFTHITSLRHPKHHVWHASYSKHRVDLALR